MIYIDADLRNADWPKRTRDYSADGKLVPRKKIPKPGKDKSEWEPLPDPDKPIPLKEDEE